MRRSPKSAGRGGYRPGRKALQLCKQVSRALSYAFSEQNSDTIRELFVDSVEPAPDESRLLVTVSPMSQGLDTVEILTALGHAQGSLRSAVAEAINRKRVPELMFQMRPQFEDE